MPPPKFRKALKEFLVNGLLISVLIRLLSRPAEYIGRVTGMLLLAAPVYGQKSGLSKLSYERAQKISRLPVVQETLLDSIDKKLSHLKGDSLSPSFQQATIPRQMREDLNALLSNNSRLILKRLPAFYAQKSIGLPSLKNTTAIQPDDFITNTLYQSGQVISTASLGVSARVAGVPFTGQLVVAYPATMDQIVTPHFKMTFEREDFLRSLKKQINQHYNPEKMLLQDLNFQEIIKGYATQKILAVKDLYKRFLPGDSTVENILHGLSVDEFLLLTKEQLRNKLQGKLLDSLTACRDVAVKKAAVSGKKDSVSLRKQLAVIDSSLAVLQNITGEIVRIKEEFEENGADYNQLIQYQKLTDRQARAVTSSEPFIQESAQDFFRQKGLSRFFVYLQRLSVGQFSADWDKHSVAGIMTSGIAGDLAKKGRFFGVQLSRIENLGWLKDAAYAGNFFEPRALLQAVRIGSGPLEKEHAHLSLVNSTTLNSYSNVLATLPRNAFTGAFSQRFAVPAIGSFDVSIAKSVTQHRNTLAEGGDRYASQMALLNFGEDFWQTLSLGLTYEGDFSSLGLRPKAFVRFAGMEYNNPASALQTRGSLGYGLALQKAFLKGKLNVQNQFSARRTNTSASADNQYIQGQNQFSAKYKLSRKIKVGAGWNLSQLLRKTGHDSHTLYFSNRVTGDVTITGKLKTLPLFHFTSLGYQRLRVPGVAESGQGKLVWASSSTALSFPKGTLSATLQYQDQRDARAVLGDFFSGEISWAYKAGGAIQLSSGLTYLNQEKTVLQFGLRQTVCAQLAQRMDVRLTSDWRVNAGPCQNPLLYPASRTDLQLFYRFK